MLLDTINRFSYLTRIYLDEIWAGVRNERLFDLMESTESVLVSPYLKVSYSY